MPNDIFVAIIMVLGLLLSACTPQVDKGYDITVGLPVNGEVTFH